MGERIKVLKSQKNHRVMGDGKRLNDAAYGFGPTMRQREAISLFSIN